MEDVLPFLAGLAYMAYKFYTNYQKGQEEARRRNPSQPYTQQPGEEAYADWADPEPVYIPDPPVATPARTEKYREPHYETAYREPVVETTVREPLYREQVTRIPTKVELENPEVPAEEVIRSRALHLPHKHKFSAHQEEEPVYYDFDFKDAIVKEAILNRPEY